MDGLPSNTSEIRREYSSTITEFQSRGAETGVGAETGFAPAAVTATAPEGSLIRAAVVQRSAHLRQMSSLERLSSRLAALMQSSSSSDMESRSSSSSSPFVESYEDDVELEEGGVWKRRKRSSSMTSIPVSLEDNRMDGEDEPKE
ncbi:hypothetical protein AZE42_11431, partial [Rhizopogon vesiculosus]